MGSLPFWKMETVGNDFVVVRRSDLPEGQEANLAIAICCRRFGVGSDGLLVVGPSRDAGFEVDLRMFNPDGTEDFCGNGLRCAAIFASDQGWASGAFRMRQHGRVSEVKVDCGSATAVLAPASFAAAEIPSRVEGESEIQGIRGTPVTTGSAHFVALVDSLPDDDLFFGKSPLIECDPAFPERISIMWTHALASHELELRIWERGVGETMGCGTGASAAAAVWAARTGALGEFSVRSVGGMLRIQIDQQEGPISSISEPRLHFSGEWPAG